MRRCGCADGNIRLRFLRSLAWRRMETCLSSERPYKNETMSKRATHDLRRDSTIIWVRLMSSSPSNRARRAYCRPKSFPEAQVAQTRVCFPAMKMDRSRPTDLEHYWIVGSAPRRKAEACSP